MLVDRGRALGEHANQVRLPPGEHVLPVRDVVVGVSLLVHDVPSRVLDERPLHRMPKRFRQSVETIDACTVATTASGSSLTPWTAAACAAAAWRTSSFVSALTLPSQSGNTFLHSNS